MSVEPMTRFVEAIAWWRLRLPDARPGLVRAAVDLLVAGDDHPSIAEMAGIPESENSFVIDSIIQRAVEEIGLADELAVAPDIVAARAGARMLLAGEIDERTLVRWVHQYFHHESETDLINELANIDDDFDGVDDGWGSTPVEALNARVHEVAALLVGTTG